MASPPASPRTQALLQAPLLPTLLRLSAPNVLGLLATPLVMAYDGYVVGRLGAAALAGLALVLPLAMLMQQMSGGALGAAATGAVARALGAGRRDHADGLVLQAVWVALAMSLLFTAVIVGGGPWLFAALGGRGAALDAALAYSRVLFGGAAVMWLTNMLAGVVRGGGQMVLPSTLLWLTAGVHALLCPVLVWGVGSWRGLGVAGAAWSTLAANAAACAVLIAHLRRGQGAVGLRGGGWRPQAEGLRRILRVGLPATLSPVLGNASVAVATACIGRYGTTALAGFGLAARLEYLVVPIAFGVGGALTAMVAANLGAGQPQRAWRATWTSAAVVTASTGALGLAVAGWALPLMGWFTADAPVQAFGAEYLHTVGLAYGLYGLGLVLFFASQGAGRVFWPLMGSTSRLLVTAVGGALVIGVWRAGPAAMFAVIALGYMAYALVTATAIARGRWGVVQPLAKA